MYSKKVKNIIFSIRFLVCEKRKRIFFIMKEGVIVSILKLKTSGKDYIWGGKILSEEYGKGAD